MSVCARMGLRVRGARIRHTQGLSPSGRARLLALLRWEAGARGLCPQGLGGHWMQEVGFLSSALSCRPGCRAPPPAGRMRPSWKPGTGAAPVGLFLPAPFQRSSSSEQTPELQDLLKNRQLHPQVFPNHVCWAEGHPTCPRPQSQSAWATVMEMQQTCISHSCGHRGFRDDGARFLVWGGPGPWASFFSLCPHRAGAGRWGCSLGSRSSHSWGLHPQDLIAS